MIIILVCADCRASCHPECKEKLPLPCIPSAPSTPGTAKMSEVRLPHWSAQVEPEKQKQDFKILALSVSVNRSVSMGESTSVFIRRFVKLKCAYRDLRILKISRIKKKKKIVSILFRNLVQSIHPTTCRSMFSEANACACVARSGENCCKLAGSMPYTPVSRFGLAVRH